MTREWQTGAGKARPYIAIIYYINICNEIKDI
jgi:hypothetical protein